MNYHSDNSGNSRPTAGDCNSIKNICAQPVTLITHSNSKLNFHMQALVCVHYFF